jgi:uncharacterized membrane protein YhaH (DUF805 family)
MSWGEVFFGFHGRLSRKTYLFAIILVNIAGLIFTATLSYLATGNPFAPEVWQAPTDKAGIWVPVWLASFAFLAWPFTALDVKRLHDRNRPAWLWYVYYGASAAVTLLPAVGSWGMEISSVAGAALLIYGIYLFFELVILKGTAGENQFGSDTLPPDYFGGDYSFWSWMLALEGRISRSKWWLGMVIVTSACLVCMIVAAMIVTDFTARNPTINLADQDWIYRPEAKPVLPLMVVLFFVFALAFWSFVALGVKRLHDRGLSTWLILVAVLPFFGTIAAPAIADRFGQGIIQLSQLLLLASAIWSVLQFGIFEGETGPNKYGPDPLAGQR